MTSGKPGGNENMAGVLPIGGSDGAASILRNHRSRKLVRW